MKQPIDMFLYNCPCNAVLSCKIACKANATSGCMYKSP